VSRAHILVEGQTEETFVQTVLRPHLSGFGVHITPIVLATGRTKQGKKFRGGVSHYDRVIQEIRLLLGDSGAAAVTTMFDFYGLPKDFPGIVNLPRGTPYERVEHLETALAESVRSRRFIPYLSLHEFEALLLSEPDRFKHHFSDAQLTEKLRHSLPQVTSPEEINDGPETHPSARIGSLFPGYRKPVFGSVIAGEIGLATLRRKCPHFGTWVAKLEAVGRG